jgi:hypothetical protein
MATSEDLVGTGGAYGTRQERVAAMRAGGLPLGSSPTSRQGARSEGGVPASPPSPGGGGFRTGLDLLGQTSPEDFPFALASDAPLPAEPSAPTSPLNALAGSAQSTFALAVLSRLRR